MSAKNSCAATTHSAGSFLATLGLPIVLPSFASFFNALPRSRLPFLVAFALPSSAASQACRNPFVTLAGRVAPSHAVGRPAAHAQAMAAMPALASQPPPLGSVVVVVVPPGSVVVVVGVPPGSVVVVVGGALGNVYVVSP